MPSRRIFVRSAIAVLLVAAGCHRPEHRLGAIAPTPGAPVIVISVDTLRADHLPMFGYAAGRTPHLDALRRDAILFTNAWSHVPLTLPSHVTLLTGRLPVDTGVRDNIGFRVTSPGHDSLPELLKSNGYATGGAVSAYVLRGETGLRALFDDYDDGIAFVPGADLGAVQRPGTVTAAAAESWIAGHRGKPFFYFLHLFEPHTPYDPPEPYRSALSSRYDGEIAYADAIVGGFLDRLKELGIYDRAVIVFLSDHGEGLGDHGEQEHGIFVYRESLHVPLLLKLPKGGPSNETVTAPVGLVDVLPTIAALTRSRLPGGLRGVSLVDTAHRADAPARRIFSESMYARLHLGWSDLRSLAGSDYHFIDAPRPELYDIRSDAAERTNVLSDQRRVYASYRHDIDQYPRQNASAAPISAEEATKLSAIGYLTSRATSNGPLPDPKDRIADLTAYQHAVEVLNNRQFDAAITELLRIVGANPSFLDAQQQLARAYEASGRYAEAETAYKAVLSKDPAMTEEVALSLGAVYLNMGRYADAKAHAELVVSRNPAAAHLLLGRVAMAQKELAAAEREGRGALRDVHFAGPAALLVAESLVKQGRAGEALALLDATAAGHPPLRMLQFDRADALVHLGRVADAEAAFREEARLFPDNRDAYAHLAAVYLLQSKVADAESVMQSLVTANPQRSSYELAADTFAQLGHPSEAAAWRRRAAEVGP